jgi:HAD domain in Swiss Army Knife RNA repair proteins
MNSMKLEKDYRDLEAKGEIVFDISKISIIFLDIDGVLNCQRGWEHYIGSGDHTTWDYSKVPEYKYGGFNRIPFCPKAVSLLNELIRLTQAKIVVISTWRHGNSLEELQGCLTERGVNGLVVGKTQSSGRLKRGEEIELWIEEFGEPKNFVIIDDDFSYDIEEFYPNNGVQPSEPEGFNEECFQKAVDILG